MDLGERPTNKSYWDTWCASLHLFFFFLLGNGPSGICLSYMLSGYRPYFSSEAIHPNTILHSKLEEARHLSIVDQVFSLPCPSFCFFFCCFVLILKQGWLSTYISIVFLSWKSFLLDNIFCHFYFQFVNMFCQVSSVYFSWIDQSRISHIIPWWELWQVLCVQISLGCAGFCYWNATVDVPKHINALN